MDGKELNKCVALFGAFFVLTFFPDDASGGNLFPFRLAQERRKVVDGRNSKNLFSQ